MRRNQLNKCLRVLILEDIPTDAELMERELRSAGIEVVSARVDNQDSFMEALDRFSPEIILSDYSLPSFDGNSALSIAREKAPSVPFIFVTGAVGEDCAVDLLKRGATDFVLKDRLSRLPLCVKRALEEANERSQRKQAEEDLRKAHADLRYLSSELLTAQEKERKRIAGELHDSIASSLSAIKFSIEKILNEMKQGVGSPESLHNLALRVAQTNDEVRRIMADLRPSILDDLGILAAITWFCREYQKTYSHISVEKQIGVVEDEVPASLRTAVFRVSQEAMNNIAKHSEASLVKLCLQKEKGKITLTIEDNGQGFYLDNAIRGLGLSTMRERTELSGGNYTIESTVGRGTVIRASWPI